MNSMLRNTIIDFLKRTETDSDSAHDLAHIRRVVKTALELAENEDADKEIVEAAAWLHDCVLLPKDHPDRGKASKLAAKKAGEFLSKARFPNEKIPGVVHAIEAHSFSGGIQPKTLEAKIVQDADRLDALGAIGIARCFVVGGKLDRAIYNPEDPFCESGVPDDSRWTVDHFKSKLFILPDVMNTKSAKQVAKKRVNFMKLFLQQLSAEMGQK